VPPEQLLSTVITTNGAKPVIAKKGNSWPKSTAQEPFYPTLHLASLCDSVCSADKVNNLHFQDHPAGSFYRQYVCMKIT